MVENSDSIIITVEKLFYYTTSLFAGCFRASGVDLIQQFSDYGLSTIAGGAPVQ
jgi:hypothetical protein